MCSAGYCGMCGTGLHRGVLLFYKKSELFPLFFISCVANVILFWGCSNHKTMSQKQSRPREVTTCSNNGHCNFV